MKWSVVVVSMLAGWVTYDIVKMIRRWNRSGSALKYGDNGHHYGDTHSSRSGMDEYERGWADGYQVGKSEVQKRVVRKVKTINGKEK